jgi:hypothetical protein
MAQPIKPPIRQPIRPVSDFRPWKPGELRRPSSGSAASDFYPHLKSKWDSPTPTPKGKPR